MSCEYELGIKYLMMNENNDFDCAAHGRTMRNIENFDFISARQKHTIFTIIAKVDLLAVCLSHSIELK